MKYIFALLFLFSSYSLANDCAAQLFGAKIHKLTVPQTIFNGHSQEFLTHQGPGRFDTALAMNISHGPIVLLRAQLGQILKVNLKYFTGWDALGEAHITTITPVEYYDILKEFISMDRIEEIAREIDIQGSDFEILGLGSAEIEEENLIKSTYFIIVSSDRLIELRHRVHEEYIANGGLAEAWDPTFFKPHITIGYTHRDLHETDGVIKDIEHTKDKRFKIVID